MIDKGKPIWPSRMEGWMHKEKGAMYGRGPET